MSVHPRISVNSLSSLFQTLPDDIAMWRELGVDNVGLISPKVEAVGWDATRDLVMDAGLRVSNVSTENHVITESLRLAAATGAGVVYACSGRAGPVTWEETAENFCKGIAPQAELANELGVALAVEPTNPLRTDVSFVFCLRDAIALARAAGISVVLDLYSSWYERDFAKLVRTHLDRIALVQVCDYLLGTFDTPNRAVVGDGDIPVERHLRTLLDAGYEGQFDIEILGPRIEEEGYASAIRRSLERTNEILDRLGA